MNSDKDLICVLLEKKLNVNILNENYNVRIRHGYLKKGALVRLISAFMELKTFKKVKLVEPSDKDQRYKKRYIWLCYDITLKQKCYYCEGYCSKEKLILTERTKNPICPACAFVHKHSNNLDACMNCKDRTCGVNIENLLSIKKNREEQEKLDKTIKQIKFDLHKKDKKKKSKKKK